MGKIRESPQFVLQVGAQHPGAETHPDPGEQRRILLVVESASRSQGGQALLERLPFATIQGIGAGDQDLRRYLVAPVAKFVQPFGGTPGQFLHQQP